jgi:hypothetical protein
MGTPLPKPKKLTAADFQTPCKPIFVSGGTAYFFKLPMVTETPLMLIGKDVERANQEIRFYSQLKKHDITSKFFLKTYGVITVDCLINADITPRQYSALKITVPRKLLVMEDLNHGYKHPRLLDIKIGDITAVAGWMGKSRFRAWKTRALDKQTNSKWEGYRLEGLDNIPGSLGSKLEFNSKNKRWRKFYLQRLSAHEFFTYALDVNHLFEQHTLVEAYCERIMKEILISLAELLQKLKAFTTPQQWIGSSLALVF